MMSRPDLPQHYDAPAFGCTNADLHAIYERIGLEASLDLPPRDNGESRATAQILDNTVQEELLADTRPPLLAVSTVMRAMIAAQGERSRANWGARSIKLTPLDTAASFAAEDLYDALGLNSPDALAYLRHRLRETSEPAITPAEFAAGVFGAIQIGERRLANGTDTTGWGSVRMVRLMDIAAHNGADYAQSVAEHLLALYPGEVWLQTYITSDRQPGDQVKKRSPDQEAFPHSGHPSAIASSASSAPQGGSIATERSEPVHTESSPSKPSPLIASRRLTDVITGELYRTGAMNVYDGQPNVEARVAHTMFAHMREKWLHHAYGTIDAATFVRLATAPTDQSLPGTTIAQLFDANVNAIRTGQTSANSVAWEAAYMYILGLAKSASDGDMNFIIAVGTQIDSAILSALQKP